MPQVIVYAVQGRSPAEKKKLMQGITQAFVEAFEVDPRRVIIQIVECAGDSKSKGGVPFSELK